MISRMLGDGTVSIESSAFRPHIEPTLAAQRQDMKDMKHKKRDKKHARQEARVTGAAPMTPQQALGLLRAHLEDIKNACGVYGVVEPYVPDCGDEIVALDEAIAILAAVVKTTEGVGPS